MTVKNKVEALLFSSGKALDVETLANITKLEKNDIKKALKELKQDYETRDCSLMILEEGDSWKINVREKYLDMVRKIVADTELPKTVLETLGVIAYKNPILQSQVIKTRTSKAYEHIKLLVELGFVIKEKQGRSYQLKIAEKFYEYFDVANGDIKDVFKNVKIPEKKPEEPDKQETLEESAAENPGREDQKPEPPVGGAPKTEIVEDKEKLGDLEVTEEEEEGERLGKLEVVDEPEDDEEKEEET